MWIYGTTSVRLLGSYSTGAGMGAPAQRMLRGAASYVHEHAPAGYMVEGSGGLGQPTPTPWFGFLNPDETSSPQEGLYVVYIFSAGLAQVTLILIQGIARLYDAIGVAEARKRLGADSEELRKGLGAQPIRGLDATVDLGSAGRLQRGYAAGTVVARRYETQALPAERQLRSDLDRFFGLYDDAVAVKRQLLQSRPGHIATSSGGEVPGVNPFEHFKPKDEADYRATVVGRTITKSRRHEWLIREYGEWAQANGFVSSTPHPRDLVLVRGGRQWLIEGKVVRRGNAMSASSGTRSIRSPVSRKTRLGPLIIHSCANGSASIRSAIAPSPIRSSRSSRASCSRSSAASSRSCPLSASASYARRTSSISVCARALPCSLARLTSSVASARSTRRRTSSRGSVTSSARAAPPLLSAPSGPAG